MPRSGDRDSSVAALSEFFAAGPALDSGTTELLLGLSDARARISASMGGFEERIRGLISAASILPGSDALLRAENLQRELRRGRVGSREQFGERVRAAEVETMNRLGAVVKAERSTIETRLVIVARRLPKDVLERIFDTVWRSENPESLDVALRVRGELRQVNTKLDEVEGEERASLAKLLDSSPPLADARTVEECRQKLSGPLADVVKAVDVLGHARQADDEAGRRVEATAAAERLYAAVQKHKSTLPPGNNDGIRGVLVSALAEAEACARSADAIGSDVDVNTMAALGAWQQGLAVVFEAGLATLARDAVDRQSLAARLSDALESLEHAISPLPETTRSPLARQIAEARATLARADQSSFDSAASVVFRTIRQVEERRDAVLAAARKDVERRADRLAGVVQQGADKVPAEVLAEARIRLIQAGGLARSGELRMIERLAGELEDLIERLPRLAQAGTMHKLNRRQAEAHQLAEEIRDFSNQAGSGFAKRLAALAAPLASDSPEPEKVRARFAVSRRSVERTVRLAALRAMDGARGAAAKGGENSPLRNAYGELEVALAGPDIARVRAATERLRAARGWRSWLDIPAVRFGVPATLVLMVVGVMVLLRMGGGTRTHEVVLDLSGLTGTAQVELVGQSHSSGKLTLDPQKTTSLAFQVPADHYSVIVNDSYTGVDVSVPLENPKKAIAVPVWILR